MAVACPGRLGDLIERGSIFLDAVEIVVIDEADRMADMGFLPDVRRLLDLTPESRQTLLFSATLDGDVDVLVRRYQNDPARHELEADRDDRNAAVHLFWKVGTADRVDTTAKVAAAAGPTIVFCRTKRSADRIARQLGHRGVRAAAIHGDRSQKQRDRALDSFIRGAVDALVATDVAARGIHVDGVNAVVHFDPPADSKDYVHRSGRTARAGATGVVVSLVSAGEGGRGQADPARPRFCRRDDRSRHRRHRRGHRPADRSADSERTDRTDGSPKPAGGPPSPRWATAGREPAHRRVRRKGRGERAGSGVSHATLTLGAAGTRAGADARNERPRTVGGRSSAKPKTCGGYRGLGPGPLIGLTGHPVGDGTAAEHPARGLSERDPRPAVG